MFPMVKILAVLGILLFAITNCGGANPGDDTKWNKVEQSTAKSFVYFYFNQDNNEKDKYRKPTYYKEYKYKKPTKSHGMKYSYTTKYKPGEDNLQSLNFLTTTPNVYKENLIDEDHHQIPPFFKSPYKSPHKTDEGVFKSDFYATTPNILKDIIDDSHDNPQFPRIPTCKYPCSLKQKPGEGPNIMSLFTTTPSSVPPKENHIEDQYLVNPKFSSQHTILAKPETSTFKYPHIPKYTPEEGFYPTTPNIFKEDLVDFQNPLNVRVKPQSIYHNPGYNPNSYNYHPKYPPNLENPPFGHPYASKLKSEDNLKFNSLSVHTTPSTLKETWWNHHHKPTVVSHLEYKLPTFPKIPQPSTSTSEENEDQENSDVSVEETTRRSKKTKDKHHKSENGSSKPSKDKKHKKKGEDNHAHKDTQEYRKHHHNKKHHGRNKHKVTHGKPYTRKIIVPIRGSSSTKTKSRKGMLHPKHFNGEVDKQTVDLINAIIETIQDNVDGVDGGSEENVQKSHKHKKQKKIKVNWSMESEGNT